MRSERDALNNISASINGKHLDKMLFHCFCGWLHALLKDNSTVFCGLLQVVNLSNLLFQLS